MEAGPARENLHRHSRSGLEADLSLPGADEDFDRSYRTFRPLHGGICLCGYGNC